ncbi:MAG TPA: hypothetical protein VFZ66_29430 [Herpetosiphonaceae bacterium]
MIVFLLLVGLLVVIEEWRVSIPTLLAAELCRIALMYQAALFAATTGRALLLAVEIVTAASVALILFVTALNFTREYNTEQLDEFALMELRRSARRSRQQRAQMTGRWSGYVVPIGAVLLAGIATWLLGQAYPVARDRSLDAAWTFSLLCGLLVLITANDALKLGLGLLLAMSSAKLLYFGVAARLNVLHIGLLELLSLMFALIVAYLSGLLYGRLHTLDLGSLFERR